MCTVFLTTTEMCRVYTHTHRHACTQSDSVGEKMST